MYAKFEEGELIKYVSPPLIVYFNPKTLKAEVTAGNLPFRPKTFSVLSDLQLDHELLRYVSINT